MKDDIIAFTEGNSLVEYNAYVEKLLVGNSVGILKTFKIGKDQDLEPISLDITENLTSISSYNDKALVTNTKGSLELIDLALDEFKGIIYRSELPLRDAVFINEGKRIICGGDDNKLIIINVEDNNSVGKIDLPEQVTNLSYNINTELLTVSLSNGNLLVYSVINEELSLMETLKSCLPNKIHSSMDEINYQEDHKHELLATRCQWFKNGEFLLVPNMSTIKLFDKNWQQSKSFDHSNYDCIVDFKISSNNRFLFVLFKVGKVLVFDLSSGSTGEPIHDLSLDLNENLPINLVLNNTDLFVGTNNGGVFCIRDSVPAKAYKSILDQDDDDDDDGSNTDALMGGDSDKEPHGINRNGIDDSIIDADDDDDNGEIDADDDGIDEEQFPYYNKDVGAVFERQSHNHHHHHSKRQRGNSGKSVSPHPLLASSSMTPRYEFQNDLIPYSPGSTPFNKVANVERRYLTTNSIGYVWVVKTNEDDSLQQSISVSFFDRSINRDYNFNDYSKFDLCGINKTGILLGSSNHSQSQRFGVIYYRSHESEQGSWSKRIPLTKGEYLTSISITDNDDNQIVVGTNFGYLRFYNKFGLCLNLIKLNPIVTLISSSTNLIFVVTQLSINLYSFSMINVNEDYRFMQQDCILPLKQAPKKPLIKGIFFSEYDDPCLVPGIDDTLIILSGWRETSNCKWIPILNCNQVITDNGHPSKKNWKCWPLGLFNDKLNSLILKNNDQYPSFPLPMPVELSIKMPINCIGKDAEYNKGDNNVDDEEDHEENFVKALTMGKITNDALTDTDYQEFSDEITEKLNYYTNLFDRSLLQLFAATCQDSNLSKAFSIAKLMKNDKALIAASKICERFEYISLANKIGKLRDQLVDLDGNY